MKLSILGGMDELEELENGTDGLFVTFRPTMKDLLDLIKLFAGLKQIRMSGVYEKTLSKSARALMEMNKIDLVVDSIKGHRKDRRGNIIEVDE
jgi:hypothetical protein